MKLVLVSFILFYSATCALILSVISHQCLRGVHVLREALVIYNIVMSMVPQNALISILL